MWQETVITSIYPPKRMRRHTQAHAGTRRHTQAHAGTRRHTQAHAGTRRHTQAHQHTHVFPLTSREPPRPLLSINDDDRACCEYSYTEDVLVPTDPAPW
jgi:hypothetical protein